MSQPPSVVITGASRGIGLACAAHMYRLGWRVVAAVRCPETALAQLQTAVRAQPDDPRMIAVRLDLTDPSSIASAAHDIEAAVGAPDGLVHNAGIAAAGSSEELPTDVWQRMFATHLFGPVALTNQLLPSMRSAGRGRIVVVSSQAAGRGLPAITPYSASKSALERWAEGLANEIAPFGLGVTVLVTGTFDTDMITEDSPHYRDDAGPYAELHDRIDRSGRRAVGFFKRSPEKFAPRLATALTERAPFARHGVGPDARTSMIVYRILPAWAGHQMGRIAMGLPRRGAWLGRNIDQ
ncbi:SDR family oxidoreductase [Mycobacterium sp.]|uniref:SDR family oxidoreductase n=1 Tax=Mycobacterium sp. TaxID=1785 RepID=UPI002DA6BE55|nr:SDR family oxidoreductase [Mycobacterium sp.]